MIRNAASVFAWHAADAGRSHKRLHEPVLTIAQRMADYASMRRA